MAVQRSLVLLLVLAVGVGAWFLFFSGPGGDPTEDLPGPDGRVDEAEPDPALRHAPRTGPPPPMVEHQIEGSGRLLMIARLRSTWNATLEVGFQRIRNLSYRTWYSIGPQHQPGPHAGPGRGLAELRKQPTAEFLRDHDIQALFVDEVDPNAYPSLFWSVVADRVRSGAMGLYVRPGFPMDDAGQALSAHPALSHPTLKLLLPIERAATLAGQAPLPGLFTEQQPFRVTAAGHAHPATQLVADEDASREYWRGASEGEGRLGTKFCYPVLELKEGAVTLVALEAGAAGIPAVVVSGGPERVLWMGNTDFGDRKTHFTREKSTVQYTLINHWCTWLTGQTP